MNDTNIVVPNGELEDLLKVRDQVDWRTSDVESIVRIHASVNPKKPAPKLTEGKRYPGRVFELGDTFLRVAAVMISDDEGREIEVPAHYGRLNTGGYDTSVTLNLVKDEYIARRTALLNARLAKETERYHRTVGSLLEDLRKVQEL